MKRNLLILLAVLVWLAPQVPAKAAAFSTDELIEGFQKTVFGLEYRSWSWRPYLVKKYTVPVRFYVHNYSRKNRRNMVHRFIREVNRKVDGLSASLSRDRRAANFEIFVVDRSQYRDVVRRDIYEDPSADVPGRCLVRVVSDSRGIKRSAAVIVSDEGEFLFRRCLVEEVLQGLGPMNDDVKLSHSVFNDQSRHSRFTVFDQLILNMLYDKRVRPGMSAKQVDPILPIVARDARRKLR